MASKRSKKNTKQKKALSQAKKSAPKESGKVRKGGSSRKKSKASVMPRPVMRRRVLVGGALVAAALLVLGLEMAFVSKKSPGPVPGGGSSSPAPKASKLSFQAVGNIVRKAPVLDMVISKDGTIYFLDTEGIKRYKNGRWIASLDLPWEMNASCSIAEGKDRLFVTRPRVAEYYTVTKDLSGYKTVPLEGAHNLYGIAVSPSGLVYIADQERAMIYCLDLEGRILTTPGGPEKSKGGLAWPTDLEVDDAGRLYAIDRGNSRVLLFDEKGKFLKSWSAPWKKASVERLAVLKGKIYINDHLGGGIHVMTTSGKKVGFIVNVEGDFVMVAPGQLAAGKDGYLYIGSHTVGKVHPL